MVILGHKDPISLKNYDPALDSLVKMDMMAGIAQGGAGQRGFYILSHKSITNMYH